MKTPKEIVEDTLGHKVIWSCGGNMLILDGQELNAWELVGMIEEYAKPLKARIKELEESLKSLESFGMETYQSTILKMYPFITDEKIKAILSFDNAWPLQDVLKKLADATDHLLNVRNYDLHGWEEVSHCVKRAREILSNFEPENK